MRIKRNSFFYKILMYFAIGGVSVLLYYFIFSPFLDTPVEFELKKTNRQLKEEYKKISETYALIDSAYANLSQRDKDIYQRLLNADPTNISELYSHSSRSDIEAYRNLSISELGDLLGQKVATVAQAADTVSTLIVSLEEKMKAGGRSFEKIPSIQPIENSKFIKSFTGSGMKIEPFFKNTKLHKGFDFAVEEGTRIFATAEGVVSRIGNFRPEGGQSVEIDHQNGYKTIYSNLSKITVRKNETVAKGDIIGYSGNSGYSFLPHLHYEVLYKGEYKDPVYFFFADLSKLQYFYAPRRAAETVQSFD